MTMSAIAPGEPLVPLVPIEEFTGEMREMAERALERAGRVPNQARAMANAGDLGAVLRRFLEDLWAKGTLPKELRLLVRYKVSTMNACVYCAAHQIFHLGRENCGDDKIEHIHEYATHPGFSERERIAIAFAEAMTRDATRIPEETAQKFVEEFTPAERVEITLVAATMGLLNGLNDALRIPLEPSAEHLAGIGIPSLGRG